MQKQSDTDQHRDKNRGAQKKDRAYGRDRDQRMPAGSVDGTDGNRDHRRGIDDRRDAGCAESANEDHDADECGQDALSEADPITGADLAVDLHEREKGRK